MSKVLITGSRKGLGAALASELRYQGHVVIGYDINDGFDVRDPDRSKLPEEIDVLVNNAAVNIIDWLENFVEGEWDRVMDTNAKGIYMMSKACLPMLIKSKGTIVNIVSNAAHKPMT